MVESNGQDRLLYFDTDSIIFVKKPGDKVIPTGVFLGDLTNEIESYGKGAKIVKFVSGGPKNYGYEVLKTDGTINSIIKTKGISANASSVELITIKSMLKLVQMYIAKEHGAPLKVEQLRFESDKFTHIVQTTSIFKAYRVVSEKRMVVGNDTYPFGYDFAFNSKDCLNYFIDCLTEPIN